MNKSGKNRDLTEINLTSLVDVSLTLVIIFMVSSPFILQSQIQVNTPSMRQAARVQEATDLKVEVYLNREGQLLLNGKEIAFESLPDSLSTLLAATRNKQVVISADGEVLHDRVVAVMDEAKQCGAEKLSIVRRK